MLSTNKSSGNVDCCASNSQDENVGKSMNSFQVGVQMPNDSVSQLSLQNVRRNCVTMEDIPLQSYQSQVKRSPAWASTPSSSASSQHNDMAISRVLTSPGQKPCPTAPENTSLYGYIDQQKRAVLLRKAVTAFLYGALKKSSMNLYEIQEKCQLKEVECAARLILNTLLLNSWRKDKIQLSKLLHENAQLTISVENLGLQLRVLRHLQSQEKDRATEKVTEIRCLKTQLNSAQKSLKNTECDLVSIQEELRYGREDNQKLVEQKSFLQKELEELLEEKGGMVDAVEAERRRANRAEEECRMTKCEYADLRKQVKDLSAQSFQWKERSRTLEAQGLEIEENVDTRESSLRLLESNFKLLLAEKEQLKSKKESLEEVFIQVKALLKSELEKNEALKCRLKNTSVTAASQFEKLAILEETICNLRQEAKTTQKELYWHKLKNVRRRRAWVNTANILGSPTNLIKYLIFGISQDPANIIVGPQQK